MVHWQVARAKGLGEWRAGRASVEIAMGDRRNARLAVKAWSAWAPGRETRADWRAWAGAADSDAEAPIAPAVPIPMMLRRRASPFGQKIVGSAAACGDALQHARYVLASRHGEFSRMIGILRALDAGELPSPAEFSMVVHHALTGLLSIDRKSTRLNSSHLGISYAVFC